MKNMPGLLVLVFCCIAVPKAHALLLQGADNFYASPYPPVLSQPLDDLPSGFDTITVGYETYYYLNGIFYQKIMRDQKYTAVQPPIGAVVFSIPPGYQYLFIDGTAYYEYGGVYYKRVLEGYRVIYPPV